MKENDRFRIETNRAAQEILYIDEGSVQTSVRYAFFVDNGSLSVKGEKDDEFPFFVREETAPVCDPVAARDDFPAGFLQ